MPVSIFWNDDNKTILIEKFEGKWTITDWYQLNDDAAVKLAEVSHTVHVIVDATDAAPPPAQMLMGVQYAIKKMPSNQGITIFVKLTRLLKMFMDFGKQIAPETTRYVYAAESLDEAHRLIAEKRQLFDQKM